MTRKKDLKPVCRWWFDSVFDVWDTGCDNAFQVMEGASPSLSGFKFCCYCGKPLIEKKERG